MIWSPYFQSSQPTCVLSLQNPGDHEILSIFDMQVSISLSRPLFDMHTCHSLFNPTNSQHKLMGIYDLQQTRRLFTLTMHRIIVRAPKLMRKGVYEHDLDLANPLALTYYDQEVYYNYPNYKKWCVSRGKNVRPRA